MNKSESLDEHGILTAAAGEAHRLGFGDPVAISAETGLGMAELYEILRPMFEEYFFQLPNSKFVGICNTLVVWLFSGQALAFLLPKSLSSLILY
jgi:predicted GTPase